MSRTRTVRRIALAAILTVSLPTATLHGERFDWRDFNGQDFTSPVRDQLSAGTCWAFAAVAVLEAKLEISAQDPVWNPDLSEQHLVCDGRAGDTYTGSDFVALDVLRSMGVVGEQELPYTASVFSPDWPLAAGWETRVARLRGSAYPLLGVEPMKQSLRQDGPFIGRVSTPEDWFWPEGLSGSSAGEPADLAGTTVDGLFAGGFNHLVAVVGYQDDEAITGGGYWIIKNSWGADWGDAGYGYIRYDVLAEHGGYASSGGAVMLPEPGCLALLACAATWLLARAPGRSGRRGPAHP